MDPKQCVYAIIVLQSFCNLCYAIFAMQSLLCRKNWKTIDGPFFSSDCKKCCWKYWKYHWCSFVFAAKVVENIMKPAPFDILYWEAWKQVVVLFLCIQSARIHYKAIAFGNMLMNMLKPYRCSLFVWARIAKTIYNLWCLQYVAETVEKQVVFFLFVWAQIAKTV